MAEIKKFHDPHAEQERLERLAKRIGGGDNNGGGTGMLEARVSNLESSVQRIETTLSDLNGFMRAAIPTLATKEDLAEVRSALPSLATKADVEKRPSRGEMWAMIGVIITAIATGAAIAFGLTQP